MSFRYDPTQGIRAKASPSVFTSHNVTFLIHLDLYAEYVAYTSSPLEPAPVETS